MDMETTAITSLDYDSSASCSLLLSGHKSGEDGAFFGYLWGSFLHIGRPRYHLQTFREGHPGNPQRTQERLSHLALNIVRQAVAPRTQWGSLHGIQGELENLMVSSGQESQWLEFYSQPTLRLYAC